MVETSVARARTGDLVVFAANGFAMASWMSRVPDAKQWLQLTPGNLGIMLLAISAGSLLGLPMAGRIAGRIGAANAVRFGAALALPGIVLAGLFVTLALPFPFVMIGLFLFGFGSGTWDVAMNLEGTVIERSLGKAIMPWFHAAFSAGTVAGALLGALIVRLEIPVLLHLAAAAALCAVAVLWGTGTFLRAFAEEPDADGAAPASSHASAWTEPRTLLVGLMVLAAGFTEGTANDWMAVAFVEGHGLDNALGVVALAVFLSFMTAGRILGTPLLDRYGRVATLRVLFGLAIVACLMVVFGSPLVSFVGAALWGLGASLGFPVGMSAAADDPQRAHARISVVSTIGYTAFLAGPPLLGFLGDHVGVLRALLAVAVVSVAAFAVVPASRPVREVEGSQA